MKRCPLVVALSASIAALGLTAPASAQSLPAVRISSTNAMPECATPGRFMAFIAERNPKLDRRYANIATAYMRFGEELGIRWDYAFFQMILETGSLAYRRGNGKPGDVKPSQNNFAGLGATGGGEPGEKFASIEDGVKAHLQHLLMYSGEHVADPVAERTRNVQQWGVLTSWQRGIKRPITFADVAGKWAPGSRGYVGDMRSIASAFYDDHCAKPDPRPEMVQEARAALAVRAPRQAAAAAPSRGVELAREANERARAEGDATRSALGAKGILGARKPAATPEPAATEQAAAPAVTILNEPSPEAPAAPPAASAPPAAKAPAAKATATPPATTVAAAATAAAAAVPLAKPSTAAQPAKCRVFTASYGGQKAVIIRAVADGFTNFTVLDVNEGQEGREVEAYVATYAKGGQQVGAFSTSNAALDEAFKLCPEG